MITITEDSIYYSPYTLKAVPHDSTEVEEVLTEDVIFHLQEYVEFGKDLTFKRLFEIIFENKEFFNILFSSVLGGVMLEDFEDEFKKKASKKKGDYILMFSWHTDYFDTLVDAFDEFRTFSDAAEMVGVRTGKKYEGDQVFSLDFMPINELKNKKVVINNFYEIIDHKYYMDKMNDPKYKDEEIFDEELKQHFCADSKDFKVYDIFESLIKEISYFGTPEEREERANEMIEMRKRMEEANEEDEEIDFEQETSWEDYQKELEEQIESEKNRLKNLVTYWEKLYPEDKGITKSLNDEVDPLENAAIIVAKTAGVSIEEQLKEAINSEEYEKAAKLDKLIKKLNKKKIGKNNEGGKV